MVVGCRHKTNMSGAREETDVAGRVGCPRHYEFRRANSMKYQCRHPKKESKRGHGEEHCQFYKGLMAELLVKTGDHRNQRSLLPLRE